MHEMLTIVTDVRGVCPSVSLSVMNPPNYPAQHGRLETHLHCVGSFSAAFDKPLWIFLHLGKHLNVLMVSQ